MHDNRAADWIVPIARELKRQLESLA